MSKKQSEHSASFSLLQIARSALLSCALLSTRSNKPHLQDRPSEEHRVRDLSAGLDLGKYHRSMRCQHAEAETHGMSGGK